MIKRPKNAASESQDSNKSRKESAHKKPQAKQNLREKLAEINQKKEKNASSSIFGRIQKKEEEKTEIATPAVETEPK